jgi:hypothetical protein
VELDPQGVGDPIILPEPLFQITKHLNLAVFALGAKNICGCFEFEALKVDLDRQCVGDLIIPPGPQFQITKHLNVAVFALRAKIFCGCLNLRLSRWNWNPNASGTL